MRLAHPQLSEPIKFRENTIPVLVLEDPKLFRDWVFALTEQAGGEAGPFVLSVNYEIIDCADHLNVIRDFHDYPLDGRRLNNKFQSLLQTIMREELAYETDKLQNSIAEYLGRVRVEIGYPSENNEGEYAVQLLKALKFRPSLDDDTDIEKLIGYLDLNTGLLKAQCFILVCAKSYFSSAELQELYKMVIYKKWHVLLVEPCIREHLPNESTIILDSDLCELRLDISADKC